jgi:RNA polymerase sigma factor (sigma-70 family)
MSDWEQQFSDLVAARGTAMTRYAYLLCGDAAMAADLTQEGLLRTFTRLRVGGDLERLEAYVRRTILNIYLDDRRRRKRWQATRHLLTGETVDQGADDTVATSDLVRTALASLSPRQRACVVLRFYEDLSVGQIASELGCSDGSVKRHLSDALARLASRLEIVQEGPVQ